MGLIVKTKGKVFSESAFRVNWDLVKLGGEAHQITNVIYKGVEESILYLTI